MSPPRTSETCAVVVLDGEQRAALAVVRSLGKKGYHVHVGSSDIASLAAASRFAVGETRLPNPLASGEDYRASVARMVAGHQARLVIPVAEASTLALLEGGTAFDHGLIPSSGLEHFRRACDKALVLDLAQRHGADVPTQWTISGEPDSEAVIPHDEYPVVVKPARSVAGEPGRRRKVGVRYANTPHELRCALQELGSDTGPFLVQTRIDGPGLGVFLLRWHDEVVASFAHRRIREKPPSGGVSVCCESVAAPPALMKQSVSLLEALDWNGVAMIEWKRDIRSGRTYLMEVNPRFWGSLQLAIDAGVDFPWYLAQLALSRPIAPVHKWRVGIRSRWYLGGIDHLVTRLRHSKSDLHLPGDAPGIFRTAMSILTPWRPGQRGEVLRFSDPAPAFREMNTWLRAL